METTLGPGFTLEEPARIQRLNALYGELQRITAATDREKERYGAAAESPEEALCCAVDYDRQSLAHIPDRVLKVDYGCGDPTVYARRGMTVLDLGSGSGKHAFMIARAVGEGGQVIGIDKTPEMLALSRGAVDEVTQNLGLAAPTVEFRAGHIENLRVGLDRLHAWLGDHEIRGYDDLEALEAYLDAEPLVADESVDLVVSNCVLNLVADHRKEQLLRELFRVLRRSGSVAISDIVCDREIPQAMKDDAELWSGCLSGAWGRQDFLDAFARAGFHGMTEVKASFWKRVEGINFFSVTIRAWKGKQGAGYETHRSALYRG
ncbi:MAG: methyltransferase domain-containing protein, partial [Planctomycetes bacterium]|nr:methyltransferase domain-containing protein [Planctomycetota bacterium]